MLKFVLLFLCVVCVLSAGAQVKHDTVLQNELKIMYKEDQRWRIEYLKLQRGEKSDYSEEIIQANGSKPIV